MWTCLAEEQDQRSEGWIEWAKRSISTNRVEKQALVVAHLESGGIHEAISSIRLRSEAKRCEVIWLRFTSTWREVDEDGEIRREALSWIIKAKPRTEIVSLATLSRASGYLKRATLENRSYRFNSCWAADQKAELGNTNGQKLLTLERRTDRKKLSDCNPHRLWTFGWKTRNLLLLTDSISQHVDSGSCMRIDKTSESLLLVRIPFD